MKTKRILFLAGGWAGHAPVEVARLFARDLRPLGFECHIEESLDHLAEPDELKTYNVIFPCWTMGSLDAGQTRGLLESVRSGVGLAGIHGGMGDAFRGNTDYEWMVGGHFVGHPHVGEYTINVRDRAHPITKDLPASFIYKSEHYYMLVDPGVHVLADSVYAHEGQTVTMPVAWIKHWGKGRVFYHSLGHAPSEFTQFPSARSLTIQGILWAARAG